jgi:hypothetical protein
MIGTTFFRKLINIFKEEFEDTTAVFVSSSCSTIGTRRVDLVTNPLISHE